MAELTEDIVASMAPSDGAMGDARGLIKKGAFRGLSRSDDGRLAFAECKGSAKEPYKVSLDFASGGDRPTMRCNCPSRQRPCKHALALGLLFAARGASFAVGQPPAELLEKSEKLKERREKQSTTEEKPREVNKAAQAKKAEQQLDALASLEKFVLDLVTTGLGGIKGKGVQAMQEQANRMGDSQLYGARARLLQLAALLNESDEDEDEDDDGIRALPRLPLTDDERHARLATGISQLWVAIRKGQRMLDGKAEEGDSKSESDAQLEALLGRAWKLPELKEAGYWVTGRRLIELCHSRREDAVLEMIITEGHLLDLDDGNVYVDWMSLPFVAARRPDARLRMSRTGVVEVREAALYPGDLVNRRIRWSDKEADAVATERRRTPDDYKKLHGLARPLDQALKAFREQLKNPLSPLDAVVLVKAARFGQLDFKGAKVPAMEDTAGARLLFRDPRDAVYPTSMNLAHAASAYGPGSVAVRLWYDPLERAIFGQALALFAGDKHLRLGMLGDPMSQDLFRTFDQDLQRLLVAGSGSASGDEGLFKAKDGFEKLATRVPALGTVAEQAGKVLGARGRAAAPELLNLSVMNLKLRGAQAKPAGEGALAPLPPAAPLETNTPQHDLEALFRSLTTGTLPSGKKINRHRTIKDAIERGVFSDLRLLDLWVRALNDSSIGDLIAEKIIPQVGEAAAARIEAQFNPQGRSADARRLGCLVAIRGEGARALVEACLKAPEARAEPEEEAVAKGKKGPAKKSRAPREIGLEVRAAAVRSLERVAPGEAEARVCALYKTEKNQEVRAACVEVMGAGDKAETLGLLLAALDDSGDVSELAVASLARFKHRETTARVLALLTPELLGLKPYKAPKAKANQKLTKAQQQAAARAEQQAQRAVSDRSEYLGRVIQVLGGRPDPVVVERLIDLFRNHAIPEVRQAAGEALKATRDRKALETLIERLEDEDYEMEQLTLWAFFHLDLATVFDRMQPYLTDAYVATKKGLQVARKLLVEVCGDGYLDEDEDDAADDEDEAAAEAAAAEAAVAAGTGGAGAGDEDEETRNRQKETSDRMGKMPFRRDPRWADVALRLIGVKELSGACASILGNLRDRRATEPLLEMLKGQQFPHDAACALIDINDRSVIPRLIAMLSLKKGLHSVIYVLGEMRATEAVDKLCELLSREVDETNQIFNTLRRLGDKKAAIPVAKALLFKGVHTYPYQAIQVLRQFDEPACIPHIQEALKKAKKSRNSWVVTQYEELITTLERDRKV